MRGLEALQAWTEADLKVVVRCIARPNSVVVNRPPAFSNQYRTCNLR